jgi:hypothetical protein
MLAIISVTDANSLVQNFNWHSPSWDLFIILGWAVASLFYAFAAGRGRVISLLMSLYTAKLLVLEAPWLTNAIDNKLPGNLGGLQELISFLIIFVLLFVLLGRYAFRTSVDGRHFGSIIFTTVFSFLQIGLLISTILGYIAATGKSFSSLITLLFLSNYAGFIWTLLPLIFLIILGRSVSDRAEV